MCLHCPDCGCNMKTNVQSDIVPEQRCWKVDHSGCEENKQLVEVASLSKTKAGAPSSGKLWSWHLNFSFIQTIHPLFYCWGFRLSFSQELHTLLALLESLVCVRSTPGLEAESFGFPSFWTKSYCHCTPLFPPFFNQVLPHYSMMNMLWLMEQNGKCMSALL